MAPKATPQISPYLTVKQVADYFNVDPKTVRRMIADGDVPAIKVRGSLRIARVDLAVIARPAPVR